MNLKRLMRNKVYDSRRVSDKALQTFFIEDLLEKHALEYIFEVYKYPVFPMSDLDSYLNESPENMEIFQTNSYKWVGESESQNGYSQPFDKSDDYFMDEVIWDEPRLTSISQNMFGNYGYYNFDHHKFVEWCRKKHYVGYQDKVTYETYAPDGVDANGYSYEFERLENPEMKTTKVGAQKFTYQELEDAFNELGMKVYNDPDNLPEYVYDIRNGYSTTDYNIDTDWQMNFDLEQVVVELANIPETILYGNLEVYFNYHPEGEGYGYAEPDYHGIFIENGKITEVY